MEGIASDLGERAENSLQPEFRHTQQPKRLLLDVSGTNGAVAGGETLAELTRNI